LGPEEGIVERIIFPLCSVRLQALATEQMVAAAQALLYDM
jgi:hypothetical protein